MAPIYTYGNSYARGQCTWYVAGRRPVPSNWGNAVSWYSRAQTAGWAVGTTPAIAAIAWTPQGYYGHVALVEDVDAQTGQVLISEMNYLGSYKLDKRWVPATTFKYIY
jgi:surface antigen